MGPMNPMNWDDLRHFLAAYREKSLAGAARVLGCEYTTVGRRLGALEAALGSTLFLRTPDGLAPTPFADDLLPLAEEAERATEAIALRAARREDERDEGTVRITCLDGFSIYVAEKLAELRKQHPKVVVEIVTDVRPLDLLRGEADIALRMSPTKERDLVTRSLCVMSWRMFASKEYLERRGTPHPIEDLTGHDVVGFDGALDHVPGAQWLAKHARGATIVSRGNSVRAVVDAAAAGLGLAVLPHFLASREPRLKLVAPDVLGTRILSIVTHPDLKDVARVRIVIDFLVAAILRDHERGAFG
jgi:DNA-binding transcriptional LysR family regulator